jgi:hypothetical protein
LIKHWIASFFAKAMADAVASLAMTEFKSKGQKVKMRGLPPYYTDGDPGSAFCLASESELVRGVERVSEK